MELNQNTNPKFNFYPSDNSNFTPGIEIEISSAIGQSFVEAIDKMQPELKKSGVVTFQIVLKLTDASHAKPLQDLVKSFIGLCKNYFGRSIDEQFNDCIKSLTVEFSADETNLYVYICHPLEKFGWFTNQFIHDYDDDESYKGLFNLNLYNGKSLVMIASELVPINILTTGLNKFIKSLFSLSVQGYSENQLNALFNYIDVAIEGEELRNKEDQDLISKEIYKPFFFFLKQYKNGKELTFENTYKAEDVKQAVFEYFKYDENLDENDDDDETLQYSLKDWQNETFGRMVDHLKSIAVGKFKQFFNIFSYTDFNQLKLSLCINEKATFVTLDIKTKGVSEYLIQTFLK